MPIAIEKTLGPTQILEYLGLLLDFINQTIGIPKKKRVKSLQMVENLIAAHKDRKNVTVNALQQTVGMLNFIVQALPAGRPFIMSLYRLARKKNGEKDRPGNHRKVTREVVEDIKMLHEWLHECAHEQVKTVPFLNRNPVFYFRNRTILRRSWPSRFWFGNLFQRRLATRTVVRNHHFQEQLQAKHSLT